MISMTITDQIDKRRKTEEFCRRCKLELPGEVAELFMEVTRWIWQYKCYGSIYQFYSDETICHGAGGSKVIGADAVLAGTLQMCAAFPDQICDFVDIFVEGSEEEGYRFGQSTRMRMKNTGYSKKGPPTNKELDRDGESYYSICELHLGKADGRWRVLEEWVIEGTDALNETLTPDIEPEECRCPVEGEAV